MRKILQAELSCVRVAAGIGLLLILAPSKQGAEPPEKPPRVDRYGDPLPKDAVVRLGTTRFRCTGRPKYSPDGKYLACPLDSFLILFDANSGKLIRKWPAPDWLRDFVFSPNGNRVAMAGDDHVEIRDVASGRQLHRFAFPDVWTVLFTRDSKQIIARRSTEYKNESMRVVDIDTGRRLWSKAGVWPTAVMPDGKHLLVLLDEAEAFLDLKSGKETARFPRKYRGELFLSKDKQLAAVWQIDSQMIEICDCLSGKITHRLKGHKYVDHLAFSQDGKFLMSANRIVDENTPTLWVWNMANGKKVREISPGPVSSAFAMSPDNRFVSYVILGESVVRRIDLRTGLESPRFAGHRSDVRQIVFSDRKVTTLVPHYSAITWDINTGKPVRTFAAEPVRTSFGNLKKQPLAISPDGKTVAVQVRDYYLQIFDITSGKPIWKKAAETSSPIAGAAQFSPDGRLLASARGDYHGPMLGFAGNYTVDVWDVDAGKTVHRWPTAPKFIPDLRFSRDGKWLAIPMGDIVGLWSMERPKNVKYFKAGLTKSLAFSPDGRTLLWAAHKREKAKTTYALWEMATHRQRARFVGAPTDAIVASSPDGQLSGAAVVAISPDGRVLAAGGHDTVVYLWDLYTGKRLPRFHGHLGAITSLAFSADGKYLASGSADTTVLIWEMASRNKNVVPSVVKLTQTELQTCWKSLAGNDAMLAYRNMCRMLGDPEATVGFLQKNLRPATPVSSKVLKQRIEQLASTSYVERERAMLALQNAGRQILPALQKALDGKPRLEVKRRLRKLVQSFDVAMGIQLQAVRAIEVLEKIGTNGSRKLLAEIARGHPLALSTELAKGALQRLGR